MTPTIGFPERWEAFNKRHQVFIAKCYPSLIELSKRIFHRHFKPRHLNDEILFLLGRAATEDFFELWLLSGNGYGIGALKILRTMFEKVATSAYLMQHPEECIRFRDYGVVQRFKVVSRMHKLRDSAQYVSDESYRELEKEYNSVKEQFNEKRCSRCGRGNPPSWTKLDMYNLAMKAGYGLGEMLIPAYAMPNLVIHATASDLAGRKIPNGDGTFRFNNEEQDSHSDGSLKIGVVLFITNMIIQNQQLSLGCETELDDLFKSAAETLAIAAKQ